MKRQTRLLISLCWAIVLGGFSCALPSCDRRGGPSGPQKISYALDWKAGMDYVGVYVAKEKGYFASAGLDVDIVQGHGGPDAAKLLATGTQGIGQCTGDSTVIGITKGMGIISLAVTHQRSPVVLFALRSSGIAEPKDLVGKTIGMNYESIKFQHYLALLHKLGIDRTKIKEVGVGWEVTPLLTGQVDALLGYVGDEPVQALKAGKELTILPLRDYGIEMYNECIVANKDWLAANKDTARKVVGAVLKGWQYAIDHPEEAVGIMQKLFPEQDAKFNALSFERIRPLLNPAGGKAGLGAQTADGWQNTIELLYDQKLIERKPEVRSVFTNDCLGG
jgi:NitT/TauT family transport system substrate-binding protein